jgi:SPP1 family holin
MKKSTIIRSILFALVILNMALKAAGKDMIDVDEGTVASFVEMLISAAILFLSFWKNNSFTKNAQKADVYLKKLKEIDESEE